MAVAFEVFLPETLEQQLDRYGKPAAPATAVKGIEARPAARRQLAGLVVAASPRQQFRTAAGVDKPGQPIPSSNSQGNLKYNDDGSIDLYFGPEPPQGAPSPNYIGTNKGEGFFVVIRLYSRGQAYSLDKTWKPDDVIKLN